MPLSSPSTDQTAPAPPTPTHTYTNWYWVKLNSHKSTVFVSVASAFAYSNLTIQRSGGFIYMYMLTISMFLNMDNNNNIRRLWNAVIMCSNYVIKWQLWRVTVWKGLFFSHVVVQKSTSWAALSGLLLVHRLFAVLQKYQTPKKMDVLLL